MIYVHKLLPVFVLPIGLTLILVVAGIVSRRMRLCWAGIAILWLGATPFVSDVTMRAAEGWAVRKPISAVPRANAIVVLSAGRIQPPGAGGLSEWMDADRFYGGIELYKASKAPLLVFTGDRVPWRPNAESEGDILMRYAADLGIPSEHMISSERAENTDQQSRAVATLLAKRLPPNTRPRILLVTSAYHMRRANLLFDRAGMDVVGFPVDFQVSADKAFSLLDLFPTASSLAQTELAMRELYGQAFYRLLLW